MLYRHYKGGVYYLHGKVQTTSSRLLLDSGELFTKAFLILPNDELDFCDVLLIKDKRSGFTQFIVESNSCGREYAIYQDTMGNFWLRKIADFFGKTTDGTPRFERMTEEMAFTYLMDETRRNAFSVAKSQI